MDLDDLIFSTIQTFICGRIIAGFSNYVQMRLSHLLVELIRQEYVMRQIRKVTALLVVKLGCQPRPTNATDLIYIYYPVTVRP